MSAEETVVAPEEITYDNLDEQIKKTGDHISDGGVFMLDMGRLKQHNTATVCFLIHILRICRQRQCRIQVNQMPPTLRKLLKLYQVNAWFA